MRAIGLALCAWFAAAVRGEPQRVNSADGRWVMSAAADALSLQDAAGREQRRWPLRTGGRHVQVLTVLDHAGRRSFVVAFSGEKELWEISYDPDAPPLHEGLVHDYRMGEALPTPGFAGRRRTPLATPLRALWLDARVPWVVGLENGPTPPVAVVLHLDVRREIRRLPWSGPLEAAQLVQRNGRWELAAPD